jgi:hypothetical protein
MSFTSDTILVALELSNSLWLVGTRTAGARSSQCTVSVLAIQRRYCAC